MLREQYVYTVTGRGEFPLDMLRYDSCWPTSQESTSAMTRSFHPRNHGPHTVAMRGLASPTVSRWESFGWQVEGIALARR